MSPLTAVTVIVDTAEDPTVIAVGELAVIVKSAPNVNMAVAMRESEPLVPFIETVNDPAVLELHDREAVAGEGGRLTLLLGLNARHVRPAGKGVSDKDTVPAKLFTAATVIVDTAEEPVGTDAGEVAAIVKS